MIEIIGHIYLVGGMFLIMGTSFVVPFSIKTDHLPLPINLIINKITIGLLFFVISGIIHYNIGVVLFDFEYLTIQELIFGKN